MLRAVPWEAQIVADAAVGPECAPTRVYTRVRQSRLAPGRVERGDSTAPPTRQKLSRSGRWQELVPTLPGTSVVLGKLFGKNACLPSAKISITLSR